VRADIWFEVSALPLIPSQLGYEEYTDRTLSSWVSGGGGIGHLDFENILLNVLILVFNSYWLYNECWPIAAVLNLFGLKDHFIDFVFVRGPPLEIVPLAHCESDLISLILLP